jgi:hypothetical protein
MRKYTKRQRSTLYGKDKEGHVQVNTRYSGARHQLGKATRGKEDRVQGSRTVQEGVCVEQRGRRKEVVGGGTGSDRSSQRQDAGVTQARGPDTSRNVKIIPWRNLWKTKEDGGKQEATADGRDKSDAKEARRQVQQRQGRGKTAMEDLGKVREQAGRPRSEVRTGVTVEEQQQVRKGAKGDLTSNRQEIGPMDRYVAVEAPSNRVREKGVKKKKDEAQGPIISAANPRQKANRRARRRHLQLHRTQAQPTLNWYGFKQEVEERRVQSADFAEDITYEMMESLYRTEDLTIIAVPNKDPQMESAHKNESALASGVRVVSLNIRTLTKHKLPVLAWYLKKYAIDCLMLQDVGCTETELRYHRADLKKLIGTEAVITISLAGQQGGDDGSVGGLMTIIQTRLGLNFVNHRVDKLNLGLIQTSTCSLGGQKLNFINTYWPVENKEGPNSLWNVTLRELRTRGIKGSPLQYVQEAIL